MVTFTPANPKIVYTADQFTQEQLEKGKLITLNACRKHHTVTKDEASLLEIIDDIYDQKVVDGLFHEACVNENAQAAYILRDKVKPAVLMAGALASFPRNGVGVVLNLLPSMTEDQKMMLLDKAKAADLMAIIETIEEFRKNIYQSC